MLKNLKISHNEARLIKRQLAMLPNSRFIQIIEDEISSKARQDMLNNRFFNEAGELIRSGLDLYQEIIQPV